MTWRSFLSSSSLPLLSRNARSCLLLYTGSRSPAFQGSLVRFSVSPRACVSTCCTLLAKRRKFAPNPDGVPSWANYDGNQKVIDGDEVDKSRLIWEGYKRNHKGGKPPKRTRKKCIWSLLVLGDLECRDVEIYGLCRPWAAIYHYHSTPNFLMQRGHKVCSNPCPICARQLTVDYKSVDLLLQFISPHTNEILPASRTGLCRLQQQKVEEAIEEARDYGLLPIIVPRKLPEEDLRTPPWNKIDIVSAS